MGNQYVDIAKPSPHIVNTIDELLLAKKEGRFGTFCPHFQPAMDKVFRKTRRACLNHHTMTTPLNP